MANWQTFLLRLVGPREETLSQGLARKGTVSGQRWSLSHMEISGVPPTFLVLTLVIEYTAWLLAAVHLDSDVLNHPTAE